VHNLARIPLRWLVRECFRTHSGIIFSCDGLRSIGLDPDSLYSEVKPRPSALPVGDHRIQPTRSPKAHSRTQKETALRNFATAEAAPESTKSEEEFDLQDALCPLYEPLALTWVWWILEFLPLTHRYQRGDTWATYFGWNLGRGRFIPKQRTNGVRVHRTVKTRLEAKSESGGKYKLAAALDLERTKWVD
jgi:hypothetical protein